jgi:predicted DNA-binding protein (MmcQ/YjbR family)
MFGVGLSMDSGGVANYCRSLRSATEGNPFGESVLVFKVGGRIFAILGDADVSLKCDPLLATALREEFAAVTPGYHLNKRHWNTVKLDESVPDDTLREWILDSYELAVDSLSRAQRAALDTTG